PHSHGSGMAVRREVRKFGFTMSGETGEVWTEARTRASGAPYRWTSVAVDRNLGRTGRWGGVRDRSADRGRRRSVPLDERCGGPQPRPHMAVGRAQPPG